MMFWYSSDSVSGNLTLHSRSGGLGVLCEVFMGLHVF